MPIVTFPPPWELGPGPADPALSQSFGSYTGSGYGPLAQGKVGTINTAPLGTQGSAPIPPVAIQRWLSSSDFLGADGNVYAYDRPVGSAYKLT